jgi:phage minor structural protein
MLPLLYNSTDPVISPDRMQYLGRLTKCKSCVVSTQLNENYELSAAFAITDDLIHEIENQRFIMAKANPVDPPQFFEIYNCVESNNEVTVKGRHIKHCAYNNIIYPDFQDAAYSDTPAGHWNFCTNRDRLSYDNYFSFVSHVTTQGAMEIGYTRADTIGKFLEEMASVFGGEFHYNNFDITFAKNIGSKKNYVLRWNRNIADPKLTLTGDNIYSHVVAYSTFHVTGVTIDYNVQICSPPVAIGSAQKLNKIYMYDASHTFDSTEINRNQFAEMREQLRLRAVAFVGGAGNALQTKEDVNLTVNYRPVLDEMSAVGLGDTVDVALKSGRTVEAKLTATSFDSLAERWTSVTLGKEKLTLADYIIKR